MSSSTTAHATAPPAAPPISQLENMVPNRPRKLLQIRKRLTYKIALFFGKARILKSDTNQELVLKQYPRYRTLPRAGLGWPANTPRASVGIEG